ncbi:MAG: 50S ribosomal protein L25 [Bacillota bacterium]|jgi:large subunit ribosomal protein L25
MEEVILKAEERTEKGKKVRAEGFVPGILYGAGKKAISVKFEASALNKVLAKHGSNAKVWIDLNNKKQFSFIKEVQRHPVEGRVIHIDVQMVSQDQEIKLQIPLSFTGTEELDKKRLLLLVAKAEVEVIGKANLMPNVIVVNVADKEAGDTITSLDFDLDGEIKINDAEDEVYAVIKEKKEQPQEEPKEDEADEAGSPEGETA